jgi:hypothetical protein
LATTHRASIVSILAVGVSLSGCADVSFGSLGTTQEHSFAEAGSSTPERTQPSAPEEAPPAIRGRIEEPETKLSGLDDRQPLVSPRTKPEEIQLTARLNPHVVSDGRHLQCVPFVREATGIDIRGNANRWWDLAKGHYERSRQPEEGAILVMRGWRTDRHGHVAVVKEILDDRTIVIDHANWLNDGKIYVNAPVRDESPKNDWSKVRVWYTPGEQWGHRIYAAKGFIYPTENAAQNGPGPILALSR